MFDVVNVHLHANVGSFSDIDYSQNSMCSASTADDAQVKIKNEESERRGAD